jgi:hypothetical protein
MTDFTRYLPLFFHIQKGVFSRCFFEAKESRVVQNQLKNATGAGFREILKLARVKIISGNSNTDFLMYFNQIILTFKIKKLWKRNYLIYSE